RTRAPPLQAVDRGRRGARLLDDDRRGTDRGFVRGLAGRVGAAARDRRRLRRPTDLALVPGSEWVLSSGMTAGGAIRLVNVRDRTTTVLFPSATARERLDKKTYDSCPGPIDPAEKDKFRAHGLYLRPARNAVHTLYVVHHGNR